MLFSYSNEITRQKTPTTFRVCLNQIIFLKKLSDVFYGYIKGPIFVFRYKKEIDEFDPNCRR